AEAALLDGDYSVHSAAPAVSAISSTAAMAEISQGRERAVVGWVLNAESFLVDTPYAATGIVRPLAIDVDLRLRNWRHANSAAALRSAGAGSHHCRASSAFSSTYPSCLPSRATMIQPPSRLTMAT